MTSFFYNTTENEYDSMSRQEAVGVIVDELEGLRSTCKQLEQEKRDLSDKVNYIILIRFLC